MGGQGKGHAAVGQLPQAQVRRGEAQMLPRDRDPQGDARVRHDVQPLYPAAAGGALLAGRADEPGLKKLRQILVQGRQADLTVPGETLPRAEIRGAVEGPVDTAARRNGARQIQRQI